jgi:hypothetical protein
VEEGVMMHVQGGPLRPQTSRPRLTLAESAGVVAVAAVALRWPFLLAFLSGLILLYVGPRLGLSHATTLILISVIGLILGLTFTLIIPGR